MKARTIQQAAPLMTASDPADINAELDELRSAFAASQEELESSRRQIEALAQTNVELRQELIVLAHKIAEARHTAYQDELTGLPARRLLLDRLNQAMVQASRQNKQVALLSLDLDGLKETVKKFGQATGDKILQQVATRLTACIRSTDTACRYEGNEFVIMLPEIDAKETPHEMVEKIRARLGVPYIVNDQVITVSASIGMAVYRGGDQNYCDLFDLIKQADVSLHLAKMHIHYPPLQLMQN